MTEIEKAYIAGIIDGEGSIMLQKFHKNQLPAPYVSVASTTIELLNWLKATVGKGSIKSIKNYNPTKHKDSYTYSLKYNDAIDLLSNIYPYLKIEAKQKRAELILTRYKVVTLRNGRYNEIQLKLKNEFYEDFINIK